MKSFGLNNYSVGLINNLHKLALNLFSWTEKEHLEFPTNMDHCLREEHTDFLQSKKNTKNQIRNLTCVKYRSKSIILTKPFLQVPLKSVKTLKQGQKRKQMRLVISIKFPTPTVCFTLYVSIASLDCLQLQQMCQQLLRFVLLKNPSKHQCL